MSEVNETKNENNKTEPAPTMAELVKLVEDNAKKGEEEKPVKLTEPVESEDTTPPVESTPPPVEKPIAKSWAALTKAEKKLQQERAEAKQERERLERERQEFEKRTKSQVDFLSQLKTDPFGTLAKAGMSFDELADRVIAGKTQPEKTSTPPPEEPEWKKAFTELKDLIVSQKTQDQEKVLLSEIDSTVKKPEFAVLATYPRAADEIYDYIVETARNTGKILPPSEVAVTLQEKWKEHLSSLKSHAAVRQVFGLPGDEKPAEEKDGEEAKQGKSGQKPEGAKGLTNQAAATGKKSQSLSRTVSEAEVVQLAKEIEQRARSGT